jgi:flagellar biosynthesis protein
MTRPSDLPKIREAVAMAYRDNDAAPRIVAKGRGLIADEIMSRAKEHGVYVHESPELLSLLMQVDLDQHIPAQLYTAVAELLAWLYRMENGQGATPPHDALKTLLPSAAEDDTPQLET